MLKTELNMRLNIWDERGDTKVNKLKMGTKSPLCGKLFFSGKLRPKSDLKRGKVLKD